MAANYLEQLLAEWYEYRGYFLRRNVLVGKRRKGGYDCELDIVGFHPERRHLVHIEPSMDSDSWAERERRFRRKFEVGRRHIPALLRGFDLPPDIEQLAVFVFASTKTHTHIVGGRVVLMGEVVEQIYRGLRGKKLVKNAVPEHLAILRTFQFVQEYHEDMLRGLSAAPGEARRPPPGSSVPTAVRARKA